MNLPKISVIMATYNHESFVAEAIRSVLAQENINFEFLIADDGSKDGTAAAVSIFVDPRIRFQHNQVNRGACIVTNELIEQSRGEYIALLNSDDSWIDANKLSKQLKFLEENPEIGATFGRARFVDRDGVEISKGTLAFGAAFDELNRSQGAWLRRFYDRGNCFCHPTMLIRKRCYEELGTYSNSYRQLPDLDMWIRLVKHYPVHISEEELINFRVLPGENASSQTTNNFIRTFNEHWLIADKFFDDVDARLLREGFDDLLGDRPLESALELEIGKTMLLFEPNDWLERPYRILGVQRLGRLLEDAKARQVLKDHYGVDDHWFQAMTGSLDVLRKPSDSLFVRLNEQTEINKNLALARENLESQLASVMNSTSWKMGAPLRWLSDVLRTKP